MQAANAIIAMAAGVVITWRISAKPAFTGECGLRTLRSHVDRGQAVTIVGKSSKHLVQSSTNTFRLAARLRCKGMASPLPSAAQVLERTSVKFAVHSDRFGYCVIAVSVNSCEFQRGGHVDAEREMCAGVSSSPLRVFQLALVQKMWAVCARLFATRCDAIGRIGPLEDSAV